jgi:hypothetical protein
VSIRDSLLTTSQFLNLAGCSHDALAGSLTDNFGNLTPGNSASLTLSQSFTNHDGATVPDQYRRPYNWQRGR